MIRDATADDLPRLLEMGEKFFNTAGWPEVVEWDVQSVEIMLLNLISSDNGVLLVIDEGEVTGMAAAMLFPFYFNLNHKCGQELFWWVEAGGALALLAALEQKSKDAGANSFIMTNVDRLRADALARVYRMRGYKPAENTFIKRL